jgi:hypothetical protein
MYALSRQQLQSLRTQTTQLASSFTYGFDPSSTGSLAKNVEQGFDRSTEIAAMTQQTLKAMYASLQQCAPSGRSTTMWDSLMSASYYDYSTACRTVQDNLNVCMASLSMQKDDRADALKSRFSKLQNSAATHEMSNLMAFHDFASHNKVNCGLADRMEARLAELDPARFGTVGDPSANRRKP